MQAQQQRMPGDGLLLMLVLWLLCCAIAFTVNLNPVLLSSPVPALTSTTTFIPRHSRSPSIKPLLWLAAYTQTTNTVTAAFDTPVRPPPISAAASSRTLL